MTDAYPPQAPAAAPANANKKTMAVLSLVFGIVSIVFAWIFPIIWILFAIAAVVLGFLSRKREPAGRGMALAGIVLGFVGIVLNIGSMIVGALLATAAYMQ